MASLAGIRLQLWVLGAIRATEAIAWTSIFPYAYYMVQSFHQVKQDQVAFYAGSLVAVFTFCEFLSGMVWARISDRIGRKPTLMIGILCSIVAALCFGFARSIELAIAARAFGGLFNPNVFLVQTCTGELAAREQQANAFSLVTFIRSLGNLIGPVLGGLLAHPVALYPSVFSEHSVWAHYRYLLPNLAVVSMQLSTMIMAVLFLRETHPNFINRHDVGLSISQSFHGFFQSLLTGMRQFSYSPLRADRSGHGADNAIDDYELENQGSPPAATRHLNPAELCSENQGSRTCEEVKEEGAPPGRTFSSQIILQILSLSLLAFHKVSSDTTMGSFLALAPSQDQHGDSVHGPGFLLEAKGGFGFNTQKIGVIFLTEAIFRVMIQGAVVPFLITRLGALKAYRWALGIYPAMYLVTPFFPGLPSSWKLVALLPDLWSKVALSSIGYVCSAILITNTVPSKQALAKINGAAASFGCLARSVGPLLSGKLFDLGVQRGHMEIPFWLLAAVALAGAGESIFLADHPE
ncbi:major facilitator superfamily domain-containing protein [Lasiosphaeria hispida]|uniref:Major facilitator superfamily domain-containing protein n=1 Tax=Lasiosphaeria hispida TaxID=260671 RepID=A0AAJ0MB78_9PEZI|nr:major facilitator superfamily domain-containing protein [Lasiosphaeria hispida]